MTIELLVDSADASITLEVQPVGAPGLPGAQGEDGAPGRGVETKGWVDTVEDLPSDAAPGDTYLVAADGLAYMMGDSGWSEGWELVGPEGPQGPQGEIGPQGPQGVQGIQGIQGLTGLTGQDGPAGAKGDKGDTGAAGQGVPAGGTSGQVLAKNSSTSYDTHWIDAPSGEGGGVSLGETETTAYRGDRGKAAYDHSQAAHAPADATAAGATGDDFATSHLAAFTHGNIANGQTAYGWGNHASAGYLTGIPSHDHSSNKLAQANTHESADTDAATTALHHTLGTGANQAAAGNDSRFTKIVPEWAQVALTSIDGVAAAAAWAAELLIPFACTVSDFSIACRSDNKPNSTVLVDMNTVNRSTGATTSALSSRASMASGEDSAAGTISGTLTCAAGDRLCWDIDQGSTTCKGLYASVKLTPTTGI